MNSQFDTHIWNISHSKLVLHCEDKSSHGSSVSTVIWLRAGWLGFDLVQGVSLFTNTSIMALGPTQPPIQETLGVKDQGLTLTIQLHLALRLRKYGVYLHSPDVFMAQCLNK